MTNNSVAHSKSPSLFWPVVSCGAAGLVAASGGSFWLLSATDQGSQVLLAAALLTLFAILGFVWLVRVRSTQRLNAVLEDYAEREIARSQYMPAHRPRSATPSNTKAM